MRQMAPLLALFLALFGAARAGDDNAGRLLSRAAQGLMEMPLEEGVGEEETLVGASHGYQVHHPKHDDLAASRLQSKAIKVS